MPAENAEWCRKETVCDDETIPVMGMEKPGLRGSRGQELNGEKGKNNLVLLLSSIPKV